ncbi:unnamed protein product [Porites lobata]|uniref:Uncharacterized protein n=1 Tax=Porites lobata TaxID=104759 RepID=A0ABN8QC60_9CNID|nr:unnamed protein product [Porites lobata]
MARARAVGVDYKFAKPGALETEDDRRKRERRNQRRISEQEKRLREVVGDLPLPPPAGPSQQEDNAYIAIRAFEVEQMTYTFSFCEAVQQPATTLPRLPAEVDIICMRRQGKDDTHKDLGLEDTVLKEPFVGSRTTILLMVMLLMMAPA